MIYSYLDKDIKGKNVMELMTKVQEFKHITLKHYPTIPDDATLVVTHGVLRGMGSVINQAIKKKIPWVCMDNGYLGKYKRVVVNSTAPTTVRKGPPRFEHGTQLLPWRGGSGKNILILPPSPPYMKTFGCEGFLNHIAHTANIFTGRDMVVRAKPAKGKKARPLQEQLDEAYAVVTWGSAIALEAIRQGIPTISLGWCPALPVSFKLDDLETITLTEEPNRMQVFDNLTWSSFDRKELADGWEIAMENTRCPVISKSS